MESYEEAFKLIDEKKYHEASQMIEKLFAESAKAAKKNSKTSKRTSSKTAKSAKSTKATKEAKGAKEAKETKSTVAKTAASAKTTATTKAAKATAKTAATTKAAAKTAKATKAAQSKEAEQKPAPDKHAELKAAIFLLKQELSLQAARNKIQELYDDESFRGECLKALDREFCNLKTYKPSDIYKRNCRRLSQYPYCFKEDFIDPEELTIKFYKLPKGGYLPFMKETGTFGNFITLDWPVVFHYFFENLDDPVLAYDVYSQYELEYLHDSVRRSEDIGRDNHVYLYYTDWAMFCNFLQCLDMMPLLKDEKVVFLFEDQIDLYPIDFEESFGIDYSAYPVKPFRISEICRLIWHSQASAHNGGDYFNEVFDSHPNLIVNPSVEFTDIMKSVKELKKEIKAAKNLEEAYQRLPGLLPDLTKELFMMRKRTDKDVFVALNLNNIGTNPQNQFKPYLDFNSRIAPILFCQPHFDQNQHRIRIDESGRAILTAEQDAEVKKTNIFYGFKYIKMFVPLRRITTSYAASMRFVHNRLLALDNKEEVSEEDLRKAIFFDTMTERMLSRNYLVDRRDRLYTDCILVKFEDAKLNPEATFRALAEFLDIPYTTSMTYCSLFGEVDPESYDGNVRGFSTDAVYRTYDDYANDDERYFLEFLFQDAYLHYGYDYHYFDKKEVDLARLDELVQGFTTANKFIHDSWMRSASQLASVQLDGKDIEVDPDDTETWETIIGQYIQRYSDTRKNIAKSVMLSQLKFFNDDGTPLDFIPQLIIDPELLKEPLYH